MLIDVLLAEAGWKVGNNGASTEEVGQEVEVDHQPTAPGQGKADYVLWGDNGKPLAVIEAKKTAIDAEDRPTQAKCYADGLERQYGQRPVIFYTNGYDIWIWNDAARRAAAQGLRLLLARTASNTCATSGPTASRRAKIAPSPASSTGMYQLEAIKRVVERFADKKRQALDRPGHRHRQDPRGRLALRRSCCARSGPSASSSCATAGSSASRPTTSSRSSCRASPASIVKPATSNDRDKRIYLATYPAMMKCFETFDVGFFDLIIADESHRSIYNRYRELFAYFDALQVGPDGHAGRVHRPRHVQASSAARTATRRPTSAYEEAISHEPPYLVPFEVVTHTTPFLREGIKYSEMSEGAAGATRSRTKQLPAPSSSSQAEVDKAVFNKDTNRMILRNLMENGIRDATGTRVGKTIIFARNHNHAVLLQNLFDEMYPQYGGNFCRVIDNHDPRAEELIDDFKGEGNNPELTIAISVDMLDTGIDVPEIVNLVFAKPVYSYVKFWQMIGRGTRLCRRPVRPRPAQDAVPDLRPLEELRVFRRERTKPPSRRRPSR